MMASKIVNPLIATRSLEKCEYSMNGWAKMDASTSPIP